MRRQSGEQTRRQDDEGYLLIASGKANLTKWQELHGRSSDQSEALFNIHLYNLPRVLVHASINLTWKSSRHFKSSSSEHFRRNLISMSNVNKNDVHWSFSVVSPLSLSSIWLSFSLSLFSSLSLGERLEERTGYFKSPTRTAYPRDLLFFSSLEVSSLVVHSFIFLSLLRRSVWTSEIFAMKFFFILLIVCVYLISQATVDGRTTSLRKHFWPQSANGHYQGDNYQHRFELRRRQAGRDVSKKKLSFPRSPRLGWGKRNAMLVEDDNDDLPSDHPENTHDSWGRTWFDDQWTMCCSLFIFR